MYNTAYSGLPADRVSYQKEYRTPNRMARTDNARVTEKNAQTQLYPASALNYVYSILKKDAVTPCLLAC